MQTDMVEMNWFQKMRQIVSDVARRKNNFANQDYELNRERVLNEDTPFQVKEAYKALRTNLIFSLPTVGCKKIIVTSALSSEGKSTNCLNIAISFAEMNAKVLLIDCDLRRPNVANLLDVQNAPGLSDYLVGLNSVDEIVHKSKYDNLSYIAAGSIPPNPSELLSSENMKNLIDKLEEQYDYIFLDTPPTNVVIDTVVVSRYVHGIVMIALQNSTDKETLRHSLNQLNFVGAKVIGFVLNGVVWGSKNSYKTGSKSKYKRRKDPIKSYKDIYKGYGKKNRINEYK